MRYIPSDLAKVLGVTTNTIRRYEESGFLKPQRDPQNYRYYDEYDINKAAAIRLYVKCGFSHEEIREMFFETDSDILSIYSDKLTELDKKIERLKRLRHWLKDNAQLIKTSEELEDNFFVMQCPALKYIIYSKNDELLTEKNRLNSIKKFIYDMPEVQHIKIYKKIDGKYIPCLAWAIKEMDIEKFGIGDFIANNPFVETYSSTLCLYKSKKMKHSDIKNKELVNAFRLSIQNQIKNWLSENGYKISGEPTEYFINMVGNTISSLICLPIDKNSLK